MAASEVPSAQGQDLRRRAGEFDGDGIPEAWGNDDEEFGDARLLELAALWDRA